ncbi:hypothetical protein ACOME3_010695, partial [Neoechinorhynchus agilis]
MAYLTLCGSAALDHYRDGSPATFARMRAVLSTDNYPEVTAPPPNGNSRLGPYFFCCPNMRRNYDRESGMNRVTPSNPEDPETAVARLTVVEKPYMDDKQRPIFDKTEMTQTKDSETTKTLEPRTVRDTERDQKSAKSAHFKVAPQYTLLTAFDIFRMARPTLKVAN